MDNLEELRSALLQRVEEASDLEALDTVRIQALGKKGEITQRMKTLGGLAPEERKEAGQAFNVIKQAVAEAIEVRKKTLHGAALEARLSEERVDVSLPARPTTIGKMHPISQTLEELVAIFGAVSYTHLTLPTKRIV